MPKSKTEDEQLKNPIEFRIARRFELNEILFLNANDEDAVKKAFLTKMLKCKDVDAIKTKFDFIVGENFIVDAILERPEQYPIDKNELIRGVSNLTIEQISPYIRMWVSTLNACNNNPRHVYGPDFYYCSITGSFDIYRFYNDFVHPETVVINKFNTGFMPNPEEQKGTDSHGKN